MQRKRAWFPLAFAALFACDGLIGEPSEGRPDAGNDEPATCDDPVRPCECEDLEWPLEVSCEAGTPTLAPSQWALLTEKQYNGALAQLVPGAAPASLPSEMGLELTEAVSDDLFAHGSEVLAAPLQLDDCSESDDAPLRTCQVDVLRRFASQAWRRELSEGEREWIAQQYDMVMGLEGVWGKEAVRLVGRSILMSTDFLLQPVTGEPLAGSDVVPLSERELINKLSLTLWNVPPDDALLARAAGRLDTPEGIREVAEEMLDDERAHEPVVDAIVNGWFGLEEILHADRSAAMDELSVDVSWLASVQHAMYEEIRRLVERVVFEEDGAIASLFSSRDAYVSPELAELYGVTAPAGGGWVELDPSERAGVMTRAGMMSMLSSNGVQSQVHRGAFVLRHLLCEPLKPPPPTVDDTPANPNLPRTPREQIDDRTARGECACCHTRINPAGGLFENYDYLGRFREEQSVVTEGGSATVAIDATGFATMYLSDEFGPTDGGVSLSAQLAESEAVRVCGARHIYDALLRVSDLTDTVDPTVEPDPEDCSRDAALAEARRSGNIRQIVLAIVSSDAFRYWRPWASEGS